MRGSTPYHFTIRSIGLYHVLITPSEGAPFPRPSPSVSSSTYAASGGELRKQRVPSSPDAQSYESSEYQTCRNE